jgi:23S rRNA pseudouridine1911/1915/1917 synthase
MQKSLVLYEDTDWRVINKPAGVVVTEKMDGFWPAHRLDKDTSGVLILAKTPEALANLREEFKARRVKKEYWALVYGQPKESSGVINQPLKRSTRYPLRRTVHPAGKEAMTEWQVEEKLGDKFTLLRLLPLTGRTHQLRAHLHFLGYPIIGDKLYNFRKQEKLERAKRQQLHAAKLTIGKQSFEAPLFDDFKEILDELRRL